MTRGVDITHGRPSASHISGWTGRIEWRCDGGGGEVSARRRQPRPRGLAVNELSDTVEDHAVSGHDLPHEL